MRSTFLAFIGLLIIPLSACNLYFSGGSEPDPDPCEDHTDYGGAERAPYPELRNPETGACEGIDWDKPTPCTGVCGPCDNDLPPNPNPLPQSSTSGSPDLDADSADAERSKSPATVTWGFCESYCTGLDEQTCLASEGCRGIYRTDSPTDGPNVFLECWQTSPEALPVQECEGLDAYTCSQLDSCIAVHEYPCDADSPSTGLVPPACVPGQFLACQNESEFDGCYGQEDCDLGYSCNAEELCLQPPGGGACSPDSGGNCDVPAICYGYCVPDSDPGECDGEVICAMPPYVFCEAGMTPGIRNGCWSGQCVSLSTCPQVSCDDIVSESMCIARSECSPYYVGVDCSCTDDSCSCAEWNFESCDEGGATAP